MYGQYSLPLPMQQFQMPRQVMPMRSSFQNMQGILGNSGMRYGQPGGMQNYQGLLSSYLDQYRNYRAPTVTPPTGVDYTGQINSLTNQINNAPQTSASTGTTGPTVGPLAGVMPVYL